MFELKGETKEKTMVRKIVDKYENITINMTNYEVAFNEIKNTIQIIDAQFENMLDELSSLKIEYQELGSKDETQASIRNRFVPMQLFELLYKQFKITEEMISWLKVKDQLTESYNHQIVSLMSSVKALDIQKNALEEVRGYVKERSIEDKERLDKILNYFENHLTNNVKNIQSQTINTFDKMLNNVLIVFKEKDSENKLFFETIVKDNEQLRLELKSIHKPYSESFNKVKNTFNENEFNKEITKPKEIVKEKIEQKKESVVTESDEFGFGEFNAEDLD